MHSTRRGGNKSLRHFQCLPRRILFESLIEVEDVEINANEAIWQIKSQSTKQRGPSITHFKSGYFGVIVRSHSVDNRTSDDAASIIAEMAPIDISPLPIQETGETSVVRRQTVRGLPLIEWHTRWHEMDWFIGWYWTSKAVLNGGMVTWAIAWHSLDAKYVLFHGSHHTKRMW